MEVVLLHTAQDKEAWETTPQRLRVESVSKKVRQSFSEKREIKNYQK